MAIGSLKTSCVILAAGAGTRMQSRHAKVLHPVGGLPMLEHVLRLAESVGADPIAVVAGFEHEKITAYVGGRARVVLQQELRGTGDALLRAKAILDGCGELVLVLSGDTPLVRPGSVRRLLDAAQRRCACAFLTADLDNPGDYGRVVRSSDGRVLRISEVSSASEGERAIAEINVGCYVFDTRLLFQALSGLKPDPSKAEYYLTDVIGTLARDHEVRAVKLDEPREAVGINSRRDLARAETIMNEEVLNRLMNQGVTIEDPATTRIGPDVSIGRDTVIYSHTVIEGATRIGSDCRVGPFARIRDSAVLGDRVTIGNFVEIVRSTIGDGVLIKHLSYIGDCEIEAGANIGAGTITANYDGTRKHKTFIGRDAQVGSGTVLVAPVKVGRQSRTGAGSVVTKNRDVPDGETVVGVPARPVRAKARKSS